MNFAGMFILTVTSLLAHAVSDVTAYNVLLAAPVTTIHVKDALCDVARSLIHRGHHVTMLSSYPPTFSHRNFTIIKVSPKLKLLQNLNLFAANSSVLESHAVAVLDATAKALWEDRPDQRRRDNLQPAVYDAVVIPEFLNELVYPFLKGFQGVLVSFYSQGAEHYIVSNALNDPSLSVNPALDAPYFGSYSLMDRFVLSLLDFNETEFAPSRVHPHARKLLKTYSPRFTGLDEFQFQSRVNLLDAHRLLDGPAIGLQPGQVEVAGLGIKQIHQSLPQEIETLWKVYGGKGIIYVSLGSYMKSSFIPKPLKEALLEALGQLHYLTLWQYEGMDLPNKDNVYKRKIMPQQDILGDSRTVLFISYCSTSAVQQAVHYGVPVLALPVALDQEKNAQKLEKLGVARILDWRTATVDALVEAASALIQEPSYSEKVKKISGIMRNDRESPAERASMWVEHAIRHHDNAPPLLPPAFTVQAVCDQELLQLYALVASVVGFLAGASLMLMCSCLYCFCCVKSLPKRKAE